MNGDAAIWVTVAVVAVVVMLPDLWRLGRRALGVWRAARGRKKEARGMELDR